MAALRPSPVIIASASVVVLLGACSSQTPGSLVASPSADADPQTVVQAFVDAVNAGETQLVLDLSQDGSSQFESWIEDGATLRDAQVLGLFDGPYGEAEPSQMTVTVSFVPEGTDDSLPPGSEVTWGFDLTNETGRWLVIGAGVG